MIEGSCSRARHLRTHNYSGTSKTAVIAPSTWEVINSHPPNSRFSKTSILITLPFIFLWLVFVWHHLVPLSGPSHSCFTFLVLTFKPTHNSIQSSFPHLSSAVFFLGHVPVIQLWLCQETEISSEFIIFLPRITQNKWCLTCQCYMENGTQSHRSS